MDAKASPSRWNLSGHCGSSLVYVVLYFCRAGLWGLCVSASPRLAHADLPGHQVPDLYHQRHSGRGGSRPLWEMIRPRFLRRRDDALNEQPGRLEDAPGCLIYMTRRSPPWVHSREHLGKPRTKRIVVTVAATRSAMGLREEGGLRPQRNRATAGGPPKDALAEQGSRTAPAAPGPGPWSRSTSGYCTARGMIIQVEHLDVAHRPGGDLSV